MGQPHGGRNGPRADHPLPFGPRNPIKTGIIGLVMLGLALGVTANLDNLGLTGGTTYTADFAEAGGLRSGEEVRIAGVQVGSVSGVALEGDHVRVTLRVAHAWIGDQTTAAIKDKDILGAEYLALDPEGGRELPPSQPIPLTRTMAPYQVLEALGGLSQSIGQINTQQLAESFQTLNQAFAGTPADVRETLTGLSALSQTIASRDQQLQQLLQNTGAVTRVVADRDQEVSALLSDGNLLLQALQQRQDSITALLQGTRQMSAQLTGLVDDDAAQLGPTLQQLNQVTGLLQRDHDDVQRDVQLVGSYFRLASTTAGNGRWIDTYICGLLPPSVGPVNPAGCQP